MRKTIRILLIISTIIVVMGTIIYWCEELL